MSRLLLCLLLASLALAGCATSPNSGDAYYTLYLAPDGSVVGGPPKPQKKSKPQKEKKQKSAAQKKSADPAHGGYWQGGGMPGAPSIVIDLGDQKALFYKGGALAGVSPVSTGREGYRTPSGQFSVQQMDRGHVSNLYGDYVDSAGNVVVANVGVRTHRRPPGTRFRGAPMPFFLRINGGVGMHAGYLPGYPASHGCIRLPREMAEIFFVNVSHGTPVRVTH